MYRPPENANRVKAIKSKFESNSATDKPPLRKVKTLSEIKRASNGNSPENRSTPQLSSSSLQRQLSDPSKRNIKRTPAFRLDKNLNGGSGSLASSPKSNRCRYLDNKASSNNNNINGTPKIESRNRFLNAQSKFEEAIEADYTAIKLLYAKPIPKAERTKPDSEESHDQTDTPTLKISELKSILDSISFDGSSLNQLKEAPLYGSLRKFPPVTEACDNLTDTLESALNRPLPCGPAPRKPPRTFTHTPVKSPRADPKYMLEKLESALQKGTLAKRALVRPPLPITPASNLSPEMGTSRFNLNCLNALSCTSAVYEAVPQPNSSFFVQCRAEPVYAEPFEYQTNASDNHSSSFDDSSSDMERVSMTRSIRQSVHYAVSLRFSKLLYTSRAAQAIISTLP